MIPGFFAAARPVEPPPPVGETAFYAGDLITSTGWEIAGYPCAFYDPEEGRTYVAWQFVGIDKGVHVAAYDHEQEEWSPLARAGNFVLPNDDHGYGMLVKDNDGYIHCLFGSHDNPQKWSVTNAPNDITAWRQVGEISGLLTYPKPVLVGSTIYLLLRNGADQSRRTLVLTSITPSAGLGSWVTGIDIIDFGPDSRVYATEVHARGTELHFCCTRSNAADSERLGVYYFIYDTATGNVLNFDKTATVTTMPVSLVQADADFRVYDHGSNVGDLPSLQFDASGDAHVLFVDGSGATPPLKHMMLSSGSWSTPETVTTISDKHPSLGYHDSYHLAPGAAGAMEAWFNADGDKARRVRSAAGVWGPLEVVAEHGDRDFVQGTPVLGAHHDLRVLFSEAAGSALDSQAMKLPMYAYGDGGFIQAVIDSTPADPFWEDVRLLLSCRDGAGASSLIDDSLSTRGAALQSGAATDGDGPFVGVRSARIGTSSARINVNNNPGQLRLPGDFTIECYVKIDSGGRIQYVLSDRDSPIASSYALMLLATGEVYFNLWGSGTNIVASVGGGVLSTGTWNHICGEVDGAVARAYLNGAVVGSSSFAGGIAGSGATMTIGQDPRRSERWLDGRVSQVRLTQAARYGGSFTPPSAPWPR